MVLCSFPRKVFERILAESNKFIPSKFLRTHDALAPEEYANHQKQGENYHTEAGTEQGNNSTENFPGLVENTQLFQACRNDDAAQHTAGDAAHTT